MADLDAALRHALNMRFELGLFDPIEDQPYWHIPPTAVRSPEHLASSLDATRQGLVLLQNPSNNVLPFKAGKKVAVVGPHTNDRTHILGNYLGQICPESVTSRVCVQSVYEAVSEVNAKTAGGATVNASGLSNVTSTDQSLLKAAIDAAKASDVIVYVGGLDTQTVERESHDRHDISLPGIQPDFLAQLAGMGKPMVLILFHGGIVTLPPSLLAHKNLAIVSAGYPGFFGGQAIAEALFDIPGVTVPDSTLAVNRWGRTPVTWYSEAGWKAANLDMLNFDMSKSPGRTYRYTDEKLVQWPFGFGLTYSSQYSELMIKEKGKVNVEVHNTGRVSDAVVLVYVQPATATTIPHGVPAAKLKRWLVHFERIDSLGDGESGLVVVDLTPKLVTLTEKDGQGIVYPGCYKMTAEDGGGPFAYVEFECSSTECGGACK